MDTKFFEKLMDIRETILSVNKDNKEYTYKLAQFDNTSMAKDCIIGTPFRYWESVPQKKTSKRKQNNTMAFDPYKDTLFDYPLVVKTVLNSNLDALDELNFHLVVQLPACGMDCWHCYNDKRVCAGFLETTIPTKPWSAKEILDKFVDCRRFKQLPGHKYNILRVSGGEPFLIPELIAELLELMGDENATDYADYPKALWTETNLVTWAEDEKGNSVVKKACKDAKARNGLDIQNTFTKYRDKLIIHPCFHGLTDKNIRECSIPTDLDFDPNLTFDDLVCGFNNLHNFIPVKPLHLYPTFIGDACDPNGVEKLFKRLCDVDEFYPLKVAIISVDYYGPVGERFEKRRTSFECYPRSASLKRWNELIKRHYGLYYAQVLRPLAEAVSSNLPKLKRGTTDILPEYEPRLILIKSTGRKEYRQDLLTILAGPPNIEIVATYDTNHVDPVVINWLKSRFKDEELGNLNEKALIVYGSIKAHAEQIRYLPMREAIVRGVEITKRLIHIKMALGNYILPRAENLEETEDLLLGFTHRMLDYFGSSNLLEPPGIRWVLIGEEALLKDWDSGKKECFESLGGIRGADFNDKELRNGWDRLLDIIKNLDDLKDLRRRGVFLQLLPRNGQSQSVINLEEGEMAEFQLRYYIPDFSEYDEDDSLKPARTIKITSAETPLSVQGYQSRALSKYGEVNFQVICNEAEDGIPGQLIIESENQSCDCPRLQLEFSLKKANASDGSNQQR
ncbi:MAG: hypothetical protein ACYSWZ_09920 [Planctomycetota bacterium]|jgi:organic radical activating enzyme